MNYFDQQAACEYIKQTQSKKKIACAKCCPHKKLVTLKLTPNIISADIEITIREGTYETTHKYKNLSMLRLELLLLKSGDEGSSDEGSGDACTKN